MDAGRPAPSRIPPAGGAPRQAWMRPRLSASSTVIVSAARCLTKTSKASYPPLRQPQWPSGEHLPQWPLAGSRTVEASGRAHADLRTAETLRVANGGRADPPTKLAAFLAQDTVACNPAPGAPGAHSSGVPWTAAGAHDRMRPAGGRPPQSSTRRGRVDVRSAEAGPHDCPEIRFSQQRAIGTPRGRSRLGTGAGISELRS